MTRVVVYTTEVCPYCRMAKELLTTKGVAFEEIRVDLDDKKREQMVRLSGRRTVPQIFINEQPVGGYDDLSKLSVTGELDKLLTSS